MTSMVEWAAFSVRASRRRKKSLANGGSLRCAILLRSRRVQRTNKPPTRQPPAALAANSRDVPFALIYRVADDGTSAQLDSAAGIDAGASMAAPLRVALGGAEDHWGLGEVVRSGHTVTRTDLESRFGGLPTGAWSIAPHTAVALPVQLPGQERARAILVAAVSPMRALDDSYRTFFGLVATQIAAAIADAQASRGRAHARRGACRARSREDGVLHQRQPRVPHAAHADARPARRSAGERRAARCRPKSRSADRARASQRPAPAEAREHAARLRAHRGRPRRGQLRADRSRRRSPLDLASDFRSAVEKAGPRASSSTARRSPSRSTSTATCGRRSSSTCSRTRSSSRSRARSGLQLRVATAARRAGRQRHRRRHSADELPRMFERFHRVQNARSQRTKAAASAWRWCTSS